MVRAEYVSTRSNEITIALNRPGVAYARAREWNATTLKRLAIPCTGIVRHSLTYPTTGRGRLGQDGG